MCSVALHESAASKTVRFGLETSSELPSEVLLRYWTESEHTGLSQLSKTTQTLASAVTSAILTNTGPLNGSGLVVLYGPDLICHPQPYPVGLGWV